MVREIAAAEPKAVANMTTDERQVALLSHLCYMSELRPRRLGGQACDPA